MQTRTLFLALIATQALNSMEECLNGVGHPAWSILQGHYTPGTLTAVPLLVLALALARRLRADDRAPANS